MVTGFHRAVRIVLLGGGLTGGLLGCSTSAHPPSLPSRANHADARRENRPTVDNAGLTIAGLKAELIDQESRLPDGRVSWSTQWRLCWAPVPGAVAYKVTTITPEGVGPPGETTDRCLALTVASGISERPRERPGRSREVDPMQSLTLSFTVAARLADGRVGPASPAIPMGRRYP